MGTEELDAALLTRLLRFAYVTCGQEALAQDLVQEAIYKVLARKRPSAVDAMEPYVKATIVNVFISMRRLRSSHETPTAQHPEVADQGFSDALLDRVVLWEGLRELPKRQRVVLVLRYYDGLNDAEIADLLGWRHSTVRSHGHRGLSALRSQPAINDLVGGRRPQPTRGGHA